jgi:hypothetical protein
VSSCSNTSLISVGLGLSAPDSLSMLYIFFCLSSATTIAHNRLQAGLEKHLSQNDLLIVSKAFTTKIYPSGWGFGVVCLCHIYGYMA